MGKETGKSVEELAAEQLAAEQKAAEAEAKAKEEEAAKQAAEAKAKEEAEAKAAKEEEKAVELKTVTILKSFRDKTDHKTWYSVGREVEFEASRAKEMVTRGLAKFTEV
jgi:hypothetical protein